MKKIVLTFFMLLGSLYSSTFNVTNTGELRLALQSATQNGEDDTIILADGTYSTTDDGLGTFEYLDNEVYDLTLIGSSSANVILDGAEQNRIFRHESVASAKLHLEKLSFINGGSSNNNTYHGGGFITNSANISIIDCNFTNNQAVNGGGFYANNTYGGTLNISNSMFTNNRARKDSYASDSGLGGGFYTNLETVISSSTFEMNSAIMSDYYDGSGGGFYIFNSVSIKNSLFSKNITDGSGGGFFANGIVTILNSDFIENSASGFDNNGNLYGSGGGFYADASGTNMNNIITNTNFIKNSAATSGGGFHSYTRSKILNSSFIENKLLATILGTQSSGAGLSSQGVISNCLIKDNHSNVYGGGMEFSGVVTNSIISNNYAKLEGAAIHANGLIFVSNSIFAGNSSGISLRAGTIDNPNIIKNNIFLEDNDSNTTRTYDQEEPIVSIENNYINLDKVSTNIRKLASNNIFNNVTLGFKDKINGDYNLTDLSDLIDAGTSGFSDNFIVDEVSYLLTDYLGDNRKVGANMDIGIYEYTTTKPTINSFTYTGTTKEFQNITFSVDYALSDDRSIGSIEYDYMNNGNFEFNNTYAFEDAKTYTVNVKVTDSSGEFSITSLRILIEELPYAEMTDAQKLIKAIDHTYYNDLIEIINIDKQNAITLAKTSGVASGKQYVLDNLGEFELVTKTTSDNLSSTAMIAGYNDGLLEGKQYVQNNLTEFNLVAKAASDTAIASATTIGIRTGEDNVKANPSTFGLVTIIDKNAAVFEATTSSLASGKQYVLDNLGEFNLVSSTECTDANPYGTTGVNGYVNRFYSLVLDRIPDESGFSDWTSQLIIGTKAGGDIAKGFFNSAEYTNRGLDNSEFLDIAYRAFFNREADAGGKTNWLTQLNQGASKDEVLNGFIGSVEFSALAESFGIETGL